LYVSPSPDAAPQSGIAMSSVLRPMSTGEVLDRAFVLYRSHFLFFAGIGTLPALTFFVAILIFKLSEKIMPGWDGNVGNTAVAGLLIAGYVLVFSLLGLSGVAMATGATIYAVSRLHLGYTTTVRESYSKVVRFTGRILRLVLTVALRMVGSWLVIFVLLSGGAYLSQWFLRSKLVLLTPLGSEIFAIVLTGGCMLGGLIWSLRIACKYSLAVPACVLENMPARQALKRSKFLAKGALFRVFLIQLLVNFVGVPIFWVLQIPGIFVAYLNQGIPNLIMVFIGALVATAVAFPIGAVGTCLVYYDQRVKKEAFDLQIMMESLAQPAIEQAAAAAPGIG